MSFSSPETAHAPGCHSWRGGGGGSLPSTSQLPDLSRSPNNEENNGSSQREKENEQWLLSPPPQLLATREGCGPGCAGAMPAPAGSAVHGARASRGRNPGWQPARGGDAGQIKGPQAPLLAPPRGEPARVRALRHVEHPKNQSKWWGAASPCPWWGG